MTRRTGFYPLVCGIVVLTAAVNADVDPQDSEIARVLKAMEQATTESERAEIIDRFPKDPATRDRIILAAAMSPEESPQLTAAMTLPTITDDENFREIAKKLGNSNSEAVRRIAALEQMIRAPSQHEQLVAKSLRSKDLLLRLMAILASDNWSAVRRAVTDASPIVRACAIVRLTQLASDDRVDGKERQLLCNQILVDPSDIVRSAALAFASELHIHPAEILSGLLFDNRKQEWLTDVFSEEDEGVALRRRLGIDEEPTWIMHRFKVALGLKESAIRRYPTEPTMPIGQPFFLGSYAAYLLRQTEIPIEPIAEDIQLNIEDSPFKRQLLRMLTEP